MQYQMCQVFFNLKCSTNSQADDISYPKENYLTLSVLFIISSSGLIILFNILVTFILMRHFHFKIKTKGTVEDLGIYNRFYYLFCVFTAYVCKL